MKNAMVSNLVLLTAPEQMGNGMFNFKFKFDIIASPTNPTVIGTKEMSFSVPNSTTIDQVAPMCYNQAQMFVNAMVNS